MQTRAYIYLTKDIPYRGEFEFPKLKTNVLDKSDKSLFIPSKRTSGNYLQCHQLLRLLYPQTMLMPRIYPHTVAQLFYIYSTKTTFSVIGKTRGYYFWGILCVLFLELCLEGLRSCDSLFMITLTNAQVCIEI